MNGYTMINMTCKKSYHCSFDCKVCIYNNKESTEYFKKLYNEVINELTKYKQQHRLNKNYNKICPICKKQFYEKRLNVKYCSDDCREKGYKITKAKIHKEWYQKNKQYQLNYQKIRYHLKKYGNNLSYQHRIYLINT